MVMAKPVWIIHSNFVQERCEVRCDLPVLLELGVFGYGRFPPPIISLPCRPQEQILWRVVGGDELQNG